MEEAPGKVQGNRLLIAFISGICSSVAVFTVSTLFTKAENTINNIIMSLLSGILVYCVLAALIYRFMHKAANRNLEKLKEQISTEQLAESQVRNSLRPILEGEISAAAEENRQISVMMVDLDHFRDICDTCGHEASEQVVSIFCQAVLKCLRGTDIIARYGGDEFIVILPNTDTDTARLLADKIRNEVSGAHIPTIDGVVISSIHCSIGISNYPVLCDDGEKLIRASDIALHLAKRSGRNYTKVYGGERTVCDA